MAKKPKSTTSKVITTDGVTFKAHTINTTDMLALVNEARVISGEKPIEPRKFLLKVKDEIGEELSGKKIRLNSNQSETEEYELTHDQALLVGMRESKAVRRSVLNKLRELETQFANPPRAGLIQDKRSAHHPMMDALIDLRQSLGKETTTVHFMSENKLCNGVVTGNFKSADEKALSNADVV